MRLNKVILGVLFLLFKNKVMFYIEEESNDMYKE